MDFDGESETFNPISIKRELSGNIMVSPNPVKEALSVDANITEAGVYTFNFIDLTGASMIQNSHMEEGLNHIQLNTENLANGFYLLQIIHPDGAVISTEKLVIE